MPKVKRTKKPLVKAAANSIHPGPAKKIKRQVSTSDSNYSKPFRNLPPEIRLEIWRHVPMNLTIINEGAKKLAEATKLPPEDRYAFDHKLRRYEEKYCSKRWATSAGLPINLLLVNKQVEGEYLSIVTKSDITLNLLYVHLQLTDVGFIVDGGQLLRDIVEGREDHVLTRMIGNQPNNPCGRITTINYRPFKDREGRTSVCQLLRYIASEHGTRHFSALKTINYLIDFREIIRFKLDHGAWDRKANGGRWYTASRPSWYWTRGLSIYTYRRFTLPPGEGQFDAQNRLDYLIADGHIDRFEIQLLNVPDHQKHLVNVGPFEPDLTSSPFRDELAMEVRWEYIGTKRWNGYLTLKRDRRANTGGNAIDQQEEH